jgi:hypothetical protein
MTIKSGYTGIDSTMNASRSTILKEMKYPNTNMKMSAHSRDTLTKCKEQQEDPHQIYAQALQCAMFDEFRELDRGWGISADRERAMSAQGQVAEKIATRLKEFARRAADRCTLDALRPSQADSGPATATDADAAVRQRCAKLEARIAAKRQEITSLKQALQRPVELPAAAGHNIFANLQSRIDAARREDDQLYRSGGAEAVVAPGLEAIASKMNESTQGLTTSVVCISHMWQQCQDEYQATQERNRQLSRSMTFAQEALGTETANPRPPMSILQNMR